MNIKELWIGEQVKMLKSGRVGRFEGLSKNGRARVAFQQKIYLVDSDKLEIYIEPKEDKVGKLTNDLNASAKTKYLFLESEIDLHIKVLNPSLINGLPEHILSHQLSACKSYILQAIKARKHQITIIHGRGMGVLKSEVLELLKSYAEISTIEAVNNSGAQRVYFKY